MFGHVWHVMGKQFEFVQEVVRIVEVQGWVFESGIAVEDAQSIDKVKGKYRFGWIVCRFWLR
jgi:hypothetical protein